mmetsp:Transcript_3181/g.10521  ORF Transcript_3181/g.10521 Transcript_3181/m.10521 type:complete len:201 (-) Transcript_3181:681-1283(-)
MPEADRSPGSRRRSPVSRRRSQAIRSACDYLGANVAPEDCQPAKILRGRVETATWRNAAEQLDEAPIRPVTTCDGDLLPLLSEWENHPWDNRQPGKLPKPTPTPRGGPSASCDGRHRGQVAANGEEVTCASGRKRRHEQRRERQRYIVSGRAAATQPGLCRSSRCQWTHSNSIVSGGTQTPPLGDHPPTRSTSNGRTLIR